MWNASRLFLTHLYFLQFYKKISCSFLIFVILHFFISLLHFWLLFLHIFYYGIFHRFLYFPSFASLRKLWKGFTRILRPFWKNCERTERTLKELWKIFERILRVPWKNITHWENYERTLKEHWKNFERTLEKLWKGLERTLKELRELRKNSERS